MLLPYDASTALDLTAELDRWKAQLDYRGPVPRSWAGRLRRDLEAEAVAASTSMEGVPVTVEESTISLPATALLRRGKRTPRASVGTAMR